MGTAVQLTRASERSGPAPGTGPLRDWCGFTLVVTGRGYRALLLTLVAVAMLPLLGSWSGFLVRTGSMEPSIHAGDVVIGRPFRADEPVPVGRVMVFWAPPGSGAGTELRVHRVVENLGRGRYTTAGDANPTPDAAPVPRENFRSRAIIQVPYVGLPLVWWHDRHYLRLALWVALTGLLLQLSFRRLEVDPPRGSGRWRRTRLAALAGTVAVVVASPANADAAFTGSTTNGSNTWRTAGTLRQAYTSAVLADSPYAFYRLDEAAGANAEDSAGNSRTGTYAGVAGYRQDGALPRNPGYAVALAANGGRVVGGGAGLLDPRTFSAETWFRTTTTTGGKLIGFESSRNATSPAYDREAFMRADGTVVYMGSATTKSLLVSPTALNNGAWHHLVVTSTPSGTQQSSSMYVDGVLVASGTTNRAATVYTGWWRVGYGTLPTGKDYPASTSFTGVVDDVAIYTTALSSSRVAAHYAAR